MTPASRAAVSAPDSAASAVATKAIDLPVPTFEASVWCGDWCQGGTVSFEATTYPEYTDLWEVWVKGTDVAALASSHADLLAALEAMVDMHETGVVSRGTVRMARDAIRKAKGLSPAEREG